MSARRDTAYVNSTPETVVMTSTEAKNGFGRVLDAVARNRTVLITKHNTAQAVVMSMEQYRALTSPGRSGLDDLTAEFDALLERMQTARSREGLREALGSSGDDLADAAVAAARQRSVA
jgi:prevent-host-death family protein